MYAKFPHLQGQYSIIQVEWKVPYRGSVKCNTHGAVIASNHKAAWMSF